MLLCDMYAVLLLRPDVIVVVIGNIKTDYLWWCPTVEGRQAGETVSDRQVGVQ